MHRSVMKALAMVVGILLATSGLVGSSAATATAAAPAGTLAEKLPSAKKSTLKISGLPYEGTATMVAQFKGADVKKGRVVSLQRRAGSQWQEIAQKKMDAKGKVTFKLAKAANPEESITYRAVAAKDKNKKKKTLAIVTTPTAKSQAWKRTFYDGFNSNTLDTKYWSFRQDGQYHNFGGSRLCSAPKASNVKLKDGNLLLTMKKASAAEAASREKVVAKMKKDAAIQSAKKAVTAAEKAKVDANKKKGSAKTKALKKAEASLKAAKKKLTKAEKSSPKGCPDGVYTNGMIGTDRKFTVQSGIIAVKIKFPIGQGMHGSAWLQSWPAQEIDVIESFGYGKGVTNVIQANNGGDRVKQLPAKASAAYVLKKDVKNKSWWNRYHVFSAEFDANKVVFRTDGKVTKTITKKLAKRDYFVVLSLLSSDWELPLLKKPVSKGVKGVKKADLSKTAMSVDWVGVWERP